MPFVSKKQARFAFGTKQPWAKEWADKTDFSKLPEKVSKKKKCLKMLSMTKSDGGMGAGVGLTTTGSGAGLVPTYGQGSYPSIRKNKKKFPNKK